MLGRAADLSDQTAKWNERRRCGGHADIAQIAAAPFKRLRIAPITDAPPLIRPNSAVQLLDLPSPGRAGLRPRATVRMGERLELSGDGRVADIQISQRRRGGKAQILRLHIARRAAGQARAKRDQKCEAESRFAHL